MELTASRRTAQFSDDWNAFTRSHARPRSRQLHLVLVRSHSLIVKKHTLILVALLLIPLFCAVAYVRDFIAADSALDSGASFDYISGRADHSVNHSFISFSHRHGTLLVMSGVSLGAALVYASFITSARWRGRAI